MERRTVSKYAALLISGIFALNFLAQKFYWYSSIWWFDMPMHFFGGFLIALLCFWLWPTKATTGEFAAKVLFGVLSVGLGWEVFELFFNNYVASNPFNYVDTFADIFFDLAGGSLGVVFIYKKITNIPKSTV